MAKTTSKEDGADIGLEFRRLLSNVASSLTSEDPSFVDEAWDFEYESLFHVGIGKRQKWRFPFMDHKRQVEFLYERTYWYRRLKPNLQRMVRNILERNVLDLKEILHTVDGVMSQLITSFPEVLMTLPNQHPYEAADRIVNNIISNCLFNYPRTVKLIKEFRKELRKAAFEKRPLPPSAKYRSISWANQVARQYNLIASSSSRAKMFRIATFCQTRATGLGNSSMVEQTIDEFIETVTVKRDFNPDPTLVESRDEVIRDLLTDMGGTSAHFRMSMSTSGCFENGRSKEGKFGFLKKAIRRSLVDPPPRFSVDNTGGELGTPLWHCAYEKADAGEADLTKVNIAGVRENGKVRVITSGSFWKETLLQPFSHLTIEIAKANRLLRDGFRAKRLGYAFVEGINILDPIRGDVIFEEDPIAFSCDWEKATDHPPHESGRFTMGPLLRGLGLTDLQVENILYAWIGDYEMFYKKRHVGTMCNGIPMGNPLTKTNISLAHPICELYARKRIYSEVQSGLLERKPGMGPVIGDIGAGNGDDLVFFVWGQFKDKFVEYFCIAAAMLGYQRSELDFLVTRDWATYCEEVFRIPTSRFDTVALGNRLKDSRYSPTLDFPKGRLIIDTQKDRTDFSSEPEGKYTLLGKDMEYVRKDSGKGINFLFAVASAQQDICLGLKYYRKPVYIPREVYSIGKMPPGWSVDSWTNAVRNLTSAWARNLTQTIVSELIGERPELLTSLKGGLSSGQRHFEKESYFEILEIPEDDPIKKFRIIKADDWKKFPVGVLEKLTGAKRLLRESTVTKHYLFQKRIESLTQEIEHVDLFDKIRSIGVILEEFDEELFKKRATKFVERYRDRPYDLKLKRPEDLYPEGLEEVLARSDPLRVDLDLPSLKRFGKRLRPDSPYERGIQELADWFAENYVAILEGQPYDLPPRQVIEDDPIIIQEASNLADTGCNMIIYVTDDVKLVRKARNKINAVHMRIRCRDWVSIGGDSELVLKSAKNHFNSKAKIEIIVDHGSLETFMDKTGSSYSYGVPFKESKPPGWTDEIVRPAPMSNLEMTKVYRCKRNESQESIIGLIRLVNPWDETSVLHLTRSARGR